MLSFKNLCKYFVNIENTSSRLEIQSQLCSLFKLVDENNIDKLIYLLDGKVDPGYINSVFNFGEKMFINILCDIFKKSNIDVKNLLAEFGDLGLVYEFLKKGEKGEGISFAEVYNSLKKITQISGNKSVEIKSSIVKGMLLKFTPLEGKFYIRIILGKLRLGFSNKTILDALSCVISGDRSCKENIESAYAKCSDLGKVAKFAIFHFNDLKNLGIIPGIPIFSKLVERSSSFDDALNRYGKVFAQPKLDGMRCQIHITSSKDIYLFSRNLENITDMFPDVVDNLKKIQISNGVILDSEIVGFNPSNNKLLTFQETIKRKRKYKVSFFQQDIPIKVFVFDIMFYNSKSLIDVSLTERLDLLNKIFISSENNENNIYVIENYLFNNSEDLYEYFESMIEKGLEGLVLKSPDSLYTPGVRNFDWMKLKRGYLKGVVDTIDVVILGYYAGGGFRAKFGVGAILVGVYNKEKDRFESICKVGSGFKNEDLPILKLKMDEFRILDKPYNYYVNESLVPDVWVKPEIVITVRSDEITKSPIHTAGVSGDTLGFALRFPRIISYRKDKSAFDTTGVSEVERLYKIEHGMI